ncbi:MAG: M1 family peptidase, partial [Chitinophagaceae bacterium]|nr:M1 family peptidase [Chitinophagaceae bacterium]
MLKKSLFAFFTLVNVTFVFAQTIDVQHYKFQILLTENSDTIKANATVQVRFNKDASEFRLNLKSVNASGKGMTVYQVFEEVPISFAHANDTLTIYLQKPAEKNEMRTFLIYYYGIPADGLIISKNKYGDRTFFADNWPNRAQNWIPCNDVPSDKASVDFIVTAPVHYKVISNGIRMDERNTGANEKTTYWREEILLPTKVMVIGAAKFAVKKFENSPDTIPVSAWVYPQDSMKGF